MSTINTTDTTAAGWTVPVASQLTMHGITYIPQDKLEDERKKRLSQVAQLTAERDQALSNLSWYKDDPDIGYDLMRKQTTLAGLTAPEIRDLSVRVGTADKRANQFEAAVGDHIRIERRLQAELAIARKERDEARAEKDSLDRAHRRVIDNLVGERNLLQKSVDREFQEKQEALRDAHKLDDLYQQARKDITYQSGCIHELQEADRKNNVEIARLQGELEKAKKDAAYQRFQQQIKDIKVIVDDLGMCQLKKPEPAPTKGMDQHLLEALFSIVGELKKRNAAA